MAIDTFEDGDYTLNPVWVKGGTGTVAVTGAAAKNGTKGLEYSNIAATQVFLTTTITEATLDTYQYIRTADVTGRASWGCLTPASASMTEIEINGSNFRWFDSTGYHNFTATPSNNTWYIFRIDYDGTNFDAHIYDDSVGLIESQTGLTPVNTGNVGKIQLIGQNTTGSIYWDDVGYSDEALPSPPAAGGQYMGMRKLW